MKSQFPKHILTEWTEVGLIWGLLREEDPKNKKATIEMYKELNTKYPSNIGVKKKLKESPETLRSKPKLKRKTLIERFRWEKKRALRWLKMTYRRLAWKTEIMLKSILKWLKNQKTVRKKDSVALPLNKHYRNGISIVVGNQLPILPSGLHRRLTLRLFPSLPLTLSSMLSPALPRMLTNRLPLSLIPKLPRRLQLGLVSRLALRLPPKPSPIPLPSHTLPFWRGRVN
jgi:hypothetical protein